MQSITLAVDVHGGDVGVTQVIPAVAQVLQLSSDNFTIALCGRTKEIQEEITKIRLDSFLESGRIFIVDAPEVVPAGESMSRIWRKYPNSSLIKAVSLQKEGIAHATLSAGDTGVLFAAALFLLGREKGVSRPALAATMPTETGSTVLLLDVGASLECKAEHLLGFGQIGYRYMQSINQDKNPKVGLLNVGSEPHKGTTKIKYANELFTQSCPGYTGYVEGGDILRGDHAVVVCDGFIGNALLKNSESLFSFMKRQIAGSLSGDVSKRLDMFNSEIYGSVPILGINGAVFKAHGGSSTNALTHAVATALKTVQLLSESDKS